MIILLDHIALSSADISKDREILEVFGYYLDFWDKDLRNPDIKVDFMKSFSYRQDLAMFRSLNNISIEFLNHGHINSETSFVIPVLENPPTELLKLGKKIELCGLDLFEGSIKTNNAPIFVQSSGAGSPFSLKKIAIQTSFLDESLFFWSSLGFKTLAHGNNCAILGFTSLLNLISFQLILFESKQKAGFYLDDLGFNCLALITNSARDEREYLKAKGIITSQIEEIIINNKTLQVFFVRGKGGEIVEIIGIKNERNN